MANTKHLQLNSFIDSMNIIKLPPKPAIPKVFMFANNNTVGIVTESNEIRMAFSDKVFCEKFSGLIEHMLKGNFKRKK